MTESVQSAMDQIQRVLPPRIHAGVYPKYGQRTRTRERTDLYTLAYAFVCINQEGHIGGAQQGMGSWH